MRCALCVLSRLKRCHCKSNAMYCSECLKSPGQRPGSDARSFGTTRPQAAGRAPKTRNGNCVSACHQFAWVELWAANEHGRHIPSAGGTPFFLKNSAWHSAVGRTHTQPRPHQLDGLWPSKGSIPGVWSSRVRSCPLLVARLLDFGSRASDVFAPCPLCWPVRPLEFAPLQEISLLSTRPNCWSSLPFVVSA
jgi:hypothetical protein